MSIIIWLVLGALVGWLAAATIKIDNLVWAIVLGAAGGFLGGWLMNAILGLDITAINGWSIVIAAVVAFLAAWIAKAFKKA